MNEPVHTEGLLHARGDELRPPVPHYNADISMTNESVSSTRLDPNKQIPVEKGKTASKLTPDRIHKLHKSQLDPLPLYTTP